MPDLMMHNALGWFEIPVADLARAKSFYQTILNVEMEDLTLGNGLQMSLFPVMPGTVGGALCYFPAFYKPGQEGPLLYLNASPSIQAVLDRVASAGGKVVVGRTQVSEEHGFIAVITDTEGNRIALQSKA